MTTSKKGQLGWDIVTGYLDSAADGMGVAQQVAHEDRYDVAKDYMQTTSARLSAFFIRLAVRS